MTVELTQTELQQALIYDAGTGAFTWRRKPCKSLPAGRPAGCLNDEGYQVIRLGGKLHKAHRLAWLYMLGEWPTLPVDHINGLRADNRFANLRSVPHQINVENQRRAHRNNSTGALGVSRAGPGFRAALRSNGVLMRIGTFATVEEASAAYLASKRRIHAGCTV